MPAEREEEQSRKLWHSFEIFKNSSIKQDNMNEDKVKVGVYGHTGRLGEPLMGILREHPNTDIVYTESRSSGKRGDLEETDTVFMALPPGTSEEYLPSLEGKRIIDLSPDHRSDWVYGLPESRREEIREAERVANPGCYATSIILGLAPLQDEVNEVYISAVSGISGAGMKPKGEDNFLSYEEGRKHYQIEEMEKYLDAEIVSFSPTRIDNTEKGILSSIFARTEDFEDIYETYEDFYKGEEFVKIEEGTVQTKDVNGTNLCRMKTVQNDKGLEVI
ncbi:hypothetical protein AKJ51_03140 [candidate division MSBL1 archaeon SCGC-AAA382A20]|uniref:Semialdehyde dehydrogenase NAD-binding domain-containing protein n=1 Tax=candidate division MSBL1 archaeon SCGC-AAA382A20 TaxID=1698280 RepID=A0A133VJS2_9EURY|nr:hypothetical protein AKJ51_03140 [candidate division MSBL1 archaeon SCGC-AAA382A20]